MLAIHYEDVYENGNKVCIIEFAQIIIDDFIAILVIVPYNELLACQLNL